MTVHPLGLVQKQAGAIMARVSGMDSSTTEMIERMPNLLAATLNFSNSQILMSYLHSVDEPIQLPMGKIIGSNNNQSRLIAII